MRLSALKWYFALGAETIERPDHEWLDLIRVAVYSAKRNTTLRPVMLYDGAPSAFTNELSSAGVDIIFHTVSFIKELTAHPAPHDWYLRIARGCFLRVDIPIIETEDDFVLYTDCDVLFKADLDVPSLPEFFGGCSERHQEQYSDLNSGVMLLNIPAMRSEWEGFTNFIKKNLSIGLDQEMYQAFYRNRYDRLPPGLNWKPYWGKNPDATIIHWHGPKPRLASQLAENPDLMTAPIWRELVSEAPDSYLLYWKEWNETLQKYQNRA